MNPTAEFARVLVQELERNRVIDVVLAPGSRSAPLAIALAQRVGDPASPLRLHVRIDERSAGFLALGLSMGSGLPTAVVCSSGSAVANLLPAVVEASHAGVPLLVLSADRPPELHRVGANQTIEQADIFGRHVRWAHTIATPEERPGQRDLWRSTIASAVSRATAPGTPGPVHLNLPMRPPLVPDDTPPAAAAPSDPVRPLPAQPAAEPVPMPAAALDAILGARHGLVISGHGGDDSVARQLGWPLVAEPTSRAFAGRILHGSLLCGDAGFAGSHRPDVVVVTGRVGLSRGVMDMVSSAGTVILAGRLPNGDLADPWGRADLLMPAGVEPLSADARQAAGSVGDEGREWFEQWMSASRAAAEVVSEHLDGGRSLSGAAVARQTHGRLLGNGLLHLAASWPVRHVEAYAGRGIAPGGRPPRLRGNRGASGIDGLVSTALGLALADQRANDRAPRVHALIGDLGFLHDHNGLLSPRDEPTPRVTYVVVDNDGGGIFSGLEQGDPRFSDVFERVFGTPHGLDLAAVARAAGLPARTANTPAQLQDALNAADAGGVEVVIARVGSRQQEVDLMRSIDDGIAERLRR